MRTLTVVELTQFCPGAAALLLQVEAVATLVAGVSESVLHSCLEREKKRNPHGSLAERISAVAKRIVPASVPGSPAYHRNKLQDLLVIVAKHGIPSLFLTLTADELSEVRWKEVTKMEELLQQCSQNEDLAWRDMPVEMARLFVDRLETFMQQHILCKRKPMLGKVDNWVLRFEAQVRLLQSDACTVCNICRLLQARAHMARLQNI
jgi:hypothetical protein